MSKEDIERRLNEAKSKEEKKKQDQKKVEFAKAEAAAAEKKTLKDKIGMVGSFAAAMASRGLANNKIDTKTKKLRVISCFGNQEYGGELPPCEYLRKSKVNGNKSYCGGCGCGDRKQTWLIAEGDEYSKLDYPKVSCPLNMPGFTNYEKSSPDEAKSPITRRYYIEQMDMKDVEKVQVTINGAPKQD